MNLEIIEQIVALIGHVIWPLSLVVIILSFRKEIRSLSTRLKSAEIKDFKFELKDKVEDIKNDAKKYGVTSIYSDEIIKNEFNPTGKLPKSYVILETWKEIERKIYSIDDRSETKSIIDSLNYLSKDGYIQEYLKKMILDLQKLRNIAVHEDELAISEQDYKNWVSISKSVMDRLPPPRPPIT